MRREILSLLSVAGLLVGGGCFTWSSFFPPSSSALLEHARAMKETGEDRACGLVYSERILGSKSETDHEAIAGRFDRCADSARRAGLADYLNYCSCAAECMRRHDNLDHGSECRIGGCRAVVGACSDEEGHSSAVRNGYIGEGREVVVGVDGAQTSQGDGGMGF